MEKPNLPLLYSIINHQTTTMHTWKKTKESLGLKDDEISAKVKTLIKRHEKNVDDLKTVRDALKTDLSQADREETETAEKELQTRVFSGDEELKQQMIRLHRDRDLNAKRRDNLKKGGGAGPGRGHKKDKGTATPAAGAAKPDSKPAAQPAASTQASGPAAGSTAAAGSPGPAGQQGSTTTASGKQAASAPLGKPSPTPSADKKKKNTGLFAALGFVVGGIVGAIIGKNIK